MPGLIARTPSPTSSASRSRSAWSAPIIVAGAAVGLKPLQDRTLASTDKRRSSRSRAHRRRRERLTPEEVIERFEENIEARVVDIETGEYVDDQSTVDLSTSARRRRTRSGATSARQRAKVTRLPKNALVYHVKKGDGVDKRSSCRSRARASGPRSTATSRWSPTPDHRGHHLLRARRDPGSRRRGREPALAGPVARPKGLR
jgi:hypothetical protein